MGPWSQRQKTFDEKKGEEEEEEEKRVLAAVDREKSGKTSHCSLCEQQTYVVSSALENVTGYLFGGGGDAL